MKPKKVIVTGGCGAIGSYIVDMCIDNDWETIVIDDLSAKCNQEFFFNEKAEYYHYDICDYDAIEPLFKDVDVVFALAAWSRIQECIEDPKRATEVNLMGMMNILEASRKHNVDRVVYSGTSSEYGLSQKKFLEEDDKRDPLNAYAISKYAAELMCQMYTKIYGVKTLTLLYFNVSSDREDVLKANKTRQPLVGKYPPMLGLFFKQFENDEPITIVGDGLQRRDFCHIMDVVNANYLAAITDNDDAFGEVFNVGTGENHSVKEIANMISDNQVHIPERPGEARETRAKTDKIQKLLGWKPQYNVIDDIRWRVEFIKSQKKNS